MGLKHRAARIYLFTAATRSGRNRLFSFSELAQRRFDDATTSPLLPVVTTRRDKVRVGPIRHRLRTRIRLCPDALFNPEAGPAGPAKRTLHRGPSRQRTGAVRQTLRFLPRAAARRRFGFGAGRRQIPCQMARGDKTVDDLYYITRTQMPFGAGNTLSKQQYIEVVAYMLKTNGYKAGSKELPADSA